MTNRAVFGLTLIIILLLVGIGYLIANQNNEEVAFSNPLFESEDMVISPTPTPSPTQTPNPSPTPSDEEQIRTFSITGENFAFSPNRITVKQGDRVQITFESKGVMHDLVIEEFDVKTNQLQAGESETIEFTADKTGSFEFYCSVGNHREMGMVGELVVE